MSIVAVVYKSLPTRVNCGSGSMLKVMYRSPLLPPADVPPCPLRRIFWPLAMPAGIVMRIFLLLTVIICLCVVRMSRSGNVSVLS